MATTGQQGGQMSSAAETCGENHSITGLLAASRGGDEAACDKLMSLVYKDLRKIAHNQLKRARAGETMSTTVLVHEAYMKLAGSTALPGKDRSHFFSIAARAMRQVMVDYARGKSRLKRRGAREEIALDETLLAIQEEAEKLIALEQSLCRLSTIDEVMTRVVECRFFIGLSERETAAALSLSMRTVQRSWARARVFLKRDLSYEEPVASLSRTTASP
jgi:RNA polymerase sigma factor (TIGR02999 family)